MTDYSSPDYLSSLLPPKFGDTRPNSRHADNYVPFDCRTELFKNSFVPSTIELYNKLPSEDGNLKTLRDKMKYKTNAFYIHGERKLNIISAQLRMGCSILKKHLFDLHVIDSPDCICGHNMEDCNHYLLFCPLYQIMRITMLDSMSEIMPIENINVQGILHGNTELNLNDNIKIVDSLH